jgi:hypothetical protein
MLAMTSRPTASKVLLVEDNRAAARGSATSPVRRYRIARIRPENRAISGGSHAATAAR